MVCPSVHASVGVDHSNETTLGVFSFRDGSLTPRTCTRQAELRAAVGLAAITVFLLASEITPVESTNNMFCFAKV